MKRVIAVLLLSTLFLSSQSTASGAFDEPADSVGPDWRCFLLPVAASDEKQEDEGSAEEDEEPEC